MLSPVDRTKENRIRVLSVERGQGTPSYGGTLIIGKEKDGWYMVNRLPLEEYLYGVVPSEMPSDYEKEALKAQADLCKDVCLDADAEKSGSGWDWYCSR